jgi:hypothetical protein
MLPTRGLGNGRYGFAPTAGLGLREVEVTGAGQFGMFRDVTLESRHKRDEDDILTILTAFLGADLWRQ